MVMSSDKNDDSELHKERENPEVYIQEKISKLTK
jgi:hypothetical protein